MRAFIITSVALSLGALGAASAAAEAPASPSSTKGRAAAGFELQEVAGGLERPVFLAEPPDGSGRLFIVEQTGKVRVVDKAGKLRKEPLLDVTSLLYSDKGEQGLLGLAFSPGFAKDRTFFINYTGKGPDGGRRDVVARYLAPPKANRAEPKSAQIILSIEDPAGNHNGGMLAFGPDGHLYVGTGDGGGANDMYGHGRDMDSLLAKMLRLDVSAKEKAKGKAYAIPDDNPFLGKPGYAPEIWQVGLRNPWRYSFDKKTGDLWIADVGQNRFEEIDFAEAGEGGQDFGWSIMEGAHCFRPKVGCDKEPLTLPVHEYRHPKGCSVTGGYVYRGSALPALEGKYLFSDFCSGEVYALSKKAGGKVSVEVLKDTGRQVSSFGQDQAGELYLLDHQGTVFKLVPPAAKK